MGKWWWWKMGVVGVAVAVAVAVAVKYTRLEAKKEVLAEWLERLGVWAMPAYVGMHTVTLCLCLPYAVVLEATAALVFGFGRGVLCIFAAKVLAASLSFWLARWLFTRSPGATGWARANKYFGLVSRGVERDGWRFVLAARFSPVPSYVINYAVAATNVRFLVDFLMPTVMGCVPMILQNASIGSLAGAATNQSGTLSLSSFFFPLLGLVSTIVISFRIKKYSSLDHHFHHT